MSEFRSPSSAARGDSASPFAMLLDSARPSAEARPAPRQESAGRTERRNGASQAEHRQTDTPAAVKDGGNAPRREGAKTGDGAAATTEADAGKDTGVNADLTADAKVAVKVNGEIGADAAIGIDAELEGDVIAGGAPVPSGDEPIADEAKIVIAATGGKETEIPVDAEAGDETKDPADPTAGQPADAGIEPALLAAIAPAADPAVSDETAEAAAAPKTAVVAPEPEKPATPVPAGKSSGPEVETKPAQPQGKPQSESTTPSNPAQAAADGESQTDSDDNSKNSGHDDAKFAAKHANGAQAHKPADVPDAVKAAPEPAHNGSLPAPAANGTAANNIIPASTHASATANVAAVNAFVAPAAVPMAGIAVEIAAQSLAGKNRFEIRLDPPELGRIDVRLDIDRDGRVTSRMVVERAETLDLLKRDAAQLERALQQAGLKTSDNALEFSLRQQTAERDDTARPEAAQLIVPDDNDDAPLEAMRQSYSRLLGFGRGLDIRV